MTPVVIETIGPVVYGVNTVSQTLDCDPVVLNLLHAVQNCRWGSFRPAHGLCPTGLIGVLWHIWRHAISSKHLSPDTSSSLCMGAHEANAVEI